MIFTDRTIIVQKGTSSINDTIVLYRGDREVEIRFTLNESSPFKFGSGVTPNIIEKTEAAYGQLVIKTPGDRAPIFSEITATKKGAITFTITAEMIDEITEVGNYTFQIRLLDENKEGRVTIPEVVNGIEVREPIATEDISDTNEVGIAAVGYALTTTGTTEDTFDSQGNYNKTTWGTGDRITAAKLNKIEAGIDGVNQKVASGGTGGEVDLSGYVTKETGNANQITFADGQTFQAKLDNGTLKGEKGDKGDTGAQGPQGIQGEQGPQGIQGPAGADGQTPNITIGTVTTLASGSSATASITGSTPNLTLNLGIPKGEKGDNGTSAGGSGTAVINPFKDKVANFLGDSQTEVNSHKTKIYHEWVKEILGLSTINNYGISGTTIAKKSSTDTTAMCVRYSNMDSTADLICVMGGVNDRWFNNPMGSMNDTDPTTFYGAMDTLCQGLYNKYPGKTIIFITPTEQNNANCNNANTTGYTATDFANAMKRVCAKYCMKVFDANTTLGIYPQITENGKVYTTDKLHLNNKGHELLGKSLANFILYGSQIVTYVENTSAGGGDVGGSDTPTEVAVESVSISGNSRVVNGNSITLTAVISPSNASNQTVTWSVNNENVSINPNGLTCEVTGVTEGEAIITVTTSDGNKTANQTITISSADVPANPYVGKTFTFTAKRSNGVNHITPVLTHTSDMDGKALLVTITGSEVSNIVNGGTGGGVFGATAPELNNSSFTDYVCTGGKMTYSVNSSDNTLNYSFSSTFNSSIPDNYLKIAMPIKLDTVPASFKIDSFSVKVDGIEREIVNLGAFFKDEACTIS